MNISSFIFSFAYFLCSAFSLQSMSVSLPQKQSTSQQSSIIIQQLQILQQIFSKANAPYSNHYSTVSNKALQQDISLITTALIAAQNCNPIIQTKIRLNTLYFNATPGSPYNKAQTLIAQRYCDNTGKLMHYGQDKKFTQSLQQIVTQELPAKIFGQLPKLFGQNMNNELLKFKSSPTWQEWWNSIWHNQKAWLETQPHQSSCTIEQAQNNQYNKDLYTFYFLCENQKFDEAEKLTKTYEHDSFFNDVYKFYYNHYQQKQQYVQKQNSDALRTKQHPSQSNYERLAQKRTEAALQTLARPQPTIKNYTVPPTTQRFLNEAGVNPKSFETCKGTPIQQRVHKELTKINDQAATLDESSGDNPEIKIITKQIPKFTHIAREYNEAGLMQEACAITDFCWALVGHAFDIITGIGKGLAQGTVNYINYVFEHPIEALARPLFGNIICALHLAHITCKLINISTIGLGTLMGSESAQEQWRQICHNMQLIKNALVKKYNALTVKKFTQETTALATQCILDYKCTQALAEFYQLGLDDAQRYLASLDTSASTAPIIIIGYKPDSFSFCTVANAVIIVAGQGRLLIEGLKHYGGNSMIASLEQILHNHKYSYCTR